MSPFSPAAAILLMLNSYCHDVATALLLVSAVWIGWAARDLGSDPHPQAVTAFLATYRRSVWAVGTALVVIMLTGVVRTINFVRFEWLPAAGRGLIPVLVVKHVLIFALVAGGGYAWWRLHRRVRRLREGATD